MKIIVPLPRRDFDPTEAAVSWRILKDAGHELFFATADGSVAAADPMMISGEGLDVWGFIPVLRKLPLFGLMLRAQKPARDAYQQMCADVNYTRPLSYSALRVENFDAMLLPGGHAKGIREYLENAELQAFVADFFDADKPVAAVCHGVVLAARSISRKTGKSVLHGRKTTALTWKLEKSGWMLTKYFARFWDPGYYRTYDEAPGEVVGYRGVQQEVTRALASPADFLDVPADAPNQFLKTGGMARDTLNDSRAAWVVRDGRYVSARWPGDVHTFARTFAALLNESR
ncbi:type 1 glutamine amidotransferase domain-containing protein [Stenotrophobium rhamnosiphilum]|uniref:ThiJ/pfpI-family protein n=1 Tax=Stenotrophobium rhamnosiphilum TaxID=2029166 RepID=A0A2T5MGC2_9GAMM|nr:type 1 glutamine amidotransferase domain-containing protein [Stenotrophobium rhamnosiphilum]PTU31628.1 thiJ/pfpI-family protein [Stenotrophobium rhamnosiphilum]